MSAGVTEPDLGGSLFAQDLWKLKLRKKMRPRISYIRVVKDKMPLLPSPGVFQELTHTDQIALAFTQSSFIHYYSIYQKYLTPKPISVTLLVTMTNQESQVREEKFILVYVFNLWLTNSIATGL